MIYAHMWHRPLVINKNQYLLAINDITEMLTQEMFLGLRLSDSQGNTKPLVSTKTVEINGVYPDRAETFAMPRELIIKGARSKKAIVLDSVKTRRYPYDSVVMASLAIFAYYCPEIKVSSTGDEADFYVVQSRLGKMFGVKGAEMCTYFKYKKRELGGLR